MAVPATNETSIEFPWRLALSPDASARWSHRSQPYTVAGRTEIWHTALLAEHGTPTVRAVGRRPVDDLFRGAVSGRDLDDLVTLTADWDLRPHNVQHLRPETFHWRVRSAGLEGYHADPEPLQASHLRLSPLGASVHLAGQWSYPPEDKEPDVLREFGMPTPSLEQYEHVAGLGRDQHVRLVRRGYLSTGHRASIVKVTERRFDWEDIGTGTASDGHEYPIRGATARLHQFFIIVVQEPERDYAPLADGYRSGGREMPFRRLRLTTLVTAPLDLPDHARQALQALGQAGGPPSEATLEEVQRQVEAALQEPFWISVGGADLDFAAVATDWAHQQVAITLPLVFVPYEAIGRPGVVLDVFSTGPQRRRTRPLHDQLMALAASEAQSPGSTIMATADVTLALQSVDDAHARALPPTFRPRFLPYLQGAEVHLSAIERLTGHRDAVSVVLADAYLNAPPGSAGDSAGIFLTLATPVPVVFGAERGGGIARPDTTVTHVSSRQGALPEAFTAPVGSTPDVAAAFAGARLFGSIPLTAILAAPTLTADDFSIGERPDEDLERLLKSDDHIPVPVLRSRRVPDGVETRFLWKPPLQPSGPLSFEQTAALVLDVRQVRTDGGASRSTTAGRLSDFSFNFAGVAKVDITTLEFRAEEHHKPDVTAAGVEFAFDGPLQFLNALSDVIPANGFSDPPAVEVTAEGIAAGYSLAIPTVGLGILSLQQLSLGAALAIPFNDRPAGLRLAISERHHPFVVTVSLFGGGGFFALGLSTRGVEELEAAIEFGGAVALNLGIAAGGVQVMAGIYFAKIGSTASLTGYLRCSGYLSVLGIVSLSIEFYLGFTFRHKNSGGTEVWGQATVTVCVHVAFFSKSVSLSLERRFAGSGGDPSFDESVSQADWERYCTAFAV